jgi:hypothetical protein
LRSEIAALPEDDPYRDVVLARLDSAEAFIAETLPVVERMESTVADAEAGPAIALSLAEFLLYFTPLAGVAGAVGSHLRGRRTRAPPVP